MNTSWITDICYSRISETEPMTQDAFKAKYFPQYAQEWRPDYRIHLNAHGCPTRSPNTGDHKRQRTIRERKVSEAYQNYLSVLTKQPV